MYDRPVISRFDRSSSITPPPGLLLLLGYAGGDNGRLAAGGDSTMFLLVLLGRTEVATTWVTSLVIGDCAGGRLVDGHAEAEESCVTLTWRPRAHPTRRDGALSEGA
jgi:hypothetical protein